MALGEQLLVYNPQQGDIIKMDFAPTKGHEQQGHRPAVVVSNASFNNFARGVALVCPVTNTDRNIAIHIKLDDRTATTGVIMTDQVKALDLAARNAKFVEKIPNDILSEICDIISGFTEIEETEN
jgi:mRNA interferase MazF